MSEKKCTITIHNELTATVKINDPQLMSFFYNKFSLHPPGYMFSPKYKLRKWDGYIHFFSKQGKTYLYIAKLIYKYLKKRDYQIEVIDNREPRKPLPSIEVDKHIFASTKNEHGESFVLRDYQVEAVNAALKQRNGIIIAGTGAGKTIISASMIKAFCDLGYRCLVLVPSRTLVHQSHHDYVMWGLDFGMYGDGIKDFDHKHLICSMPSLHKKPMLLQDYDVLIVDECQHVKADLMFKNLTTYGTQIQFRYGLTGSMPNEQIDNLQVRMCLGDIFYEIRVKKLIEENVLSSVHIHILQLQEGKVAKEIQDASVERKYLAENDLRLQEIAKIVKQKTEEKGNSLILVNNLSTGRKLAKLIPGSHFVHGSVSQKVRKEIYDLFSKSDNTIVFAVVKIASTGLNIKRIFNLFLLDIRKSYVTVVQSIGRGLRRDDKTGKQHCDVYDVCSNMKYSKHYLTIRKKYYEELGLPYTITKIKYKNE
jgi:superfamily II DNA or RNA helicase